MRSRLSVLTVVMAAGIAIVIAGALWAMFPPASTHVRGPTAAAGAEAADASEAPAGSGVLLATTSPSSPSKRLKSATLVAPADPRKITVSGAHFFAWTFLDRRIGRTTGSANSASGTNTVESMIKAWIVADYLRRLDAAGRQPTATALKELTVVIVDSNDQLADKYYQIGGADAVVRRLISSCGLTNVTIKPGLWSWTEMTARDAAKYGLCVGDGRAAGPWTKWLLETMQRVRGGVGDQREDGSVQGGLWGIIDGLPADVASQTSIKNGWTSYVDGWHVNCLAVHQDWVLTVMIRAYGGLGTGARACQSVAKQLVVSPS